MSDATKPNHSRLYNVQMYMYNSKHRASTCILSNPNQRIKPGKTHAVCTYKCTCTVYE